MNVEINMLSNMIVNYIQSKSSIDPMGIQLISSVVINMLTNIYNNIKNVSLNDPLYSNYISIMYNYIILNYIYILLITLVVYMYMKRVILYDFINSKKIKHEYTTPIKISDGITYYMIDITDVTTLINSISSYMEMNPSFFKTSVSKKIVEREGKLLNIFESKVLFDDKIHNRDGYITTSYSITESAKGNINHYPPP